jgi:hypothetical protein
MASVCSSRAWRGAWRGSECGAGSRSDFREFDKDCMDSSNIVREESKES